MSRPFEIGDAVEVVDNGYYTSSGVGVVTGRRGVVTAVHVGWVRVQLHSAFADYSYSNELLRLLSAVERLAELVELA